jgi:hypothetical protein
VMFNFRDRPYGHVLTLSRILVRQLTVALLF